VKNRPKTKKRDQNYVIARNVHNTATHEYLFSTKNFQVNL